MKKYFFLFICFLFTISFSEQKFLTIEQIKSEYEFIQYAMNQYEKVVVRDSENSSEGGEAGYYYDNKKLKVIVTDYLGETGKLHEEIYFSDNYPIFVYKERHEYNGHIADKKINDKKTKIHKERFYFDSNKNLIRYIDEKGKIITNDEKLQKYSLEVKKEIVRLLKLRSKA